jgi:hypothetical protein
VLIASGDLVLIASGDLFFPVTAGSSGVTVGVGRRGERGAFASTGLFITRGSPGAMVGFRGR